jgi:hypothetical protein
MGYECLGGGCFALALFGTILSIAWGVIFLGAGNVDNCDELRATVTSIERNPSLLDTGNSVVKFAFNATHYSIPVVEHCSVALHNAWPDAHTKHHYPIGSSHDIYDCDGQQDGCATAQSLHYDTSVGTWLLSFAGSMVLLYAVLFCFFNYCDKPPQATAR